MLISTVTCDFYLVFHISYKPKLNGLAKFWKKTQIAHSTPVYDHILKYGPRPLEF